MRQLIDDVDREHGRSARACAVLRVFDFIRGGGLSSPLLRRPSYMSVVVHKVSEIIDGLAELIAAGPQSYTIPADGCARLLQVCMLILRRVGLGGLLLTRTDLRMFDRVALPAVAAYPPSRANALEVSRDYFKHRRLMRAVGTHIKHTRSLEDRCRDMVAAEPRQRQVGHRCSVMWEGDYHAAKIVWISKYGRTCRYVFADPLPWWGWELESHPAKMAELHDYDRAVYDDDRVEMPTRRGLTSHQRYVLN